MLHLLEQRRITFAKTTFDVANPVIIIVFEKHFMNDAKVEKSMQIRKEE